MEKTTDAPKNLYCVTNKERDHCLPSGELQLFLACCHRRSELYCDAEVLFEYREALSLFERSVSMKSASCCAYHKGS